MHDVAGPPTQPARLGRRSPGLMLAVGLFASAVSVVATMAPSSPATAAPIEETRSAAGPLGGISIIGDSVMMGSLYFGPDLPDRLVEAGWGPVRARAGEGYSTGYFGVDTTYKASYWLRQWRAQGWDPDAVVVNFGANDVGLCAYRNESLDDCSYHAIMHLVDAIGPGKRIWWPKITRFPLQRHEQDAWNAALDRVATERPDFFTWDWPTVMYELGLYSPDRIHQSPEGYRQRSRLMAYEVTATLARGRVVGGPAGLPAPVGPVAEMLPIGPTRVLDTRADPPGRLAAGQTVEIDVAADVPPGTTAVAAYITAARPGAAGHLTAHPCLARPGDTSFTNYAGASRGAVTITPLTPALTFCVTTHAATDLVVDLQAAFVPDGLRLTPLAEPTRLLDTRGTELTHDVEIDVPDGAEAVAINITAVRGARPGHVTVHPCLDPIPDAANLNFLADETIASAAYVPVSAAGTICLHAYSLVDLVVDLTGVFTTDGDLAFQPVAPKRMLDTRTGIGGFGPIHGLGQTVRAVVAPPNAAAVTGTVTIVAPMRRSHLQAWACGARKENSNVNAAPGLVRANFLTTGTDAGTLCIVAVNTGNTLFDTTGWWIP